MPVHAELRHVTLRRVDQHVVPGLVNFRRLLAQRFRDFHGQDGRFGRPVGQGHFVARFRTRHYQPSTQGIESDFTRIRFQVGQHHMRRGQGGVATQVHFHVGGEPTQVISSRRLVHEKRRFRHGIFTGQIQQHLVLQPRRQGHHACRVSREYSLRECVNAVQVQFHGRKVRAAEALSLH